MRTETFWYVLEEAASPFTLRLCHAGFPKMLQVSARASFLSIKLESEFDWLRTEDPFDLSCPPTLLPNLEMRWCQKKTSQTTDGSVPQSVAGTLPENMWPGRYEANTLSETPHAASFATFWMAPRCLMFWLRAFMFCPFCCLNSWNEA